MTTATAHGTRLPTTVGEIAAHWRRARSLYDVFAPLYREHNLGALCPDLESPVDRNDREALERMGQWFAAADAKIEAWQVRQLVQTSHLGGEEHLRALVKHFLEREERTPHRDILDFLLVQYFTQHAPLSVHDRDDFDLEIVAEVLEPAIGEAVPHEPRCTRPLNDELEKLRRCRSLGELLQSGVLARGREVKEAAGEMFFGTAALLAFTRFNFLVRRAFFRLMQADLGVVRGLLRKMEAAGVAAVDCTAAGLDANESVAGLRQFCNNWKVPFRAPYDCGRPLLPLVTIREAAERALEIARSTPVARAEEKAAEAEIATIPAEAPQPVEESAAAAEAKESEPGSGEFQVMPTAAAHEHPAHIEAPRIEPEVVKATAAAPGSEVEAPIAGAERRATGEGVPAEISAPAPGTSPIPTIDHCLEEIAPQLLRGEHSVTVTRINCCGSKLLISSWEAAAFIRGGDETSDALQRAVAARSILVQALDRHKSGDDTWLGPALDLARREMAQAQDQVARAKEAQDIDAAVNLAATATRLVALVQDASKYVP